MRVRNCHICGKRGVWGTDYRHGVKPVCAACAEAIGRDPSYGLRRHTPRLQDRTMEQCECS